MRKVAGLICILALTFGAVASFAAPPKVITVKAPKGSNTTGKYAYVPVGPDYGKTLAPYKAQNHLNAAVNQGLKSSAMKAPAFHNGTIDTVPYFQNWFITGSRNSIYPYSMVGQNPKAGGTTGVNNRILPLAITLNDFFGNPLFTFDPTVANDPEGSDVALLQQSPLYDATTTYPGPPADTGQIVDTAQRVTFRTVRAANWHTVLNPAQTDFSYHIFLDPSSWAYLIDSHGNVVGEAVDITVLETVFGLILNIENSNVPLPNNTVPIFLTDYLTAYIPNGGGCCVLGFHTAQTGIADPNGILVWTWGTYIPHSANNPFGAFGFDSMVLSHELSELFNDPFVNTNVADWVDGSVSFAQGNLETGDVIEGMSDTDVIYYVPLNTSGGPYTYSLQNVATLEWFTRNPFNGGIYSWPSEHTLSQAPHPVGCTLAIPQCWSYGQGSAGFFFGPPY